MVCVSSSFYYALLARNKVFLLLNFFGVQLAFCLSSQQQVNVVGKTQCLKFAQKVAFNIASEASYVYILSGQNLIKNAKNGQFCASFGMHETCV